MHSFGSGRRGDGRLFWSGGSTGAVLELPIDVPVSATCAVEIAFTRAPDYANVQVEVDGKPPSTGLSAYAPKVSPPQALQAGRFARQAGPTVVSVMMIAKSAPASISFVGIDRIRLTPSGP